MKFVHKYNVPEQQYMFQNIYIYFDSIKLETINNKCGHKHLNTITLHSYHFH